VVKINRNLLVALLFYLFAFILDSSITTYGISNNLGSEGDKIVLWLWGIFGKDSLLLKAIYVALVFTISWIIYRKFSKFIGLFIPYSLAIGHILGFSTWIFFLNNYFGLAILYKFHVLLGSIGIFIVAPLIGLFLSFVHSKKIKR
jgi:hypothetical protein